MDAASELVRQAALVSARPAKRLDGLGGPIERELAATQIVERISGRRPCRDRRRSVGNASAGRCASTSAMPRRRPATGSCGVELQFLPKLRDRARPVERRPRPARPRCRDSSERAERSDPLQRPSERCARPFELAGVANVRPMSTSVCGNRLPRDRVQRALRRVHLLEAQIPGREQERDLRIVRRRTAGFFELLNRFGGPASATRACASSRRVGTSRGFARQSRDRIATDFAASPDSKVHQRQPVAAPRPNRPLRWMHADTRRARRRPVLPPFPARPHDLPSFGERLAKMTFGDLDFVFDAGSPPPPPSTGQRSR